MKIKHHYTFRDDEVEITEFLRNKNIKFKESRRTITTEICEDDIYWDNIKTLMAQYNIPNIVDIIYSNDEIQNASWFDIRSKWRWEYPQPDSASEYEHATYSNDGYCEKCGSGLVQKDYFRIRKEPQWGKRSFLMLNWIEDELFVNNEVTTALAKCHINGYELYDVKNKKDNKTVENIKQMYVKEIINPGLLKINDTIRREITCPLCGTKKYIINGKGFVYKKECFQDVSVDIAKSSEFFGDGCLCARAILVSKKFYNAIKDSSLDKDLIFIPLTLF